MPPVEKHASCKKEEGKVSSRMRKEAAEIICGFFAIMNVDLRDALVHCSICHFTLHSFWCIGKYLTDSRSAKCLMILKES